MKCPYCGSEKMDIITPVLGDRYALFEIDTTAGKRVSKALAVDVYCCSACNGVMLKSDFKSED